MTYTKLLKKCTCGKLPKLITKPEYVKYSCNRCDLNTFFTHNELTSRELWNAQIENITKLKVKI